MAVTPNAPSADTRGGNGNIDWPPINKITVTRVGGAGGPYRNVALVSKQKQMFDPIASRFRACFKRSSPLILLQNNYSCFKESKKRKVF